ncbi:hypothetical protein [Bacillus phage Chedec 11]|uniref:Uncharacterized protein n=1 Tax=Bacillus phage Chedec 11 TaxID=2932672 RepID=A0A976MZJ5_9CAUD|nr:hypothetical protein [Bacillus phage Chedec 11]
MNNYQLTIKEVLDIIKTSREYTTKISTPELHTITVKELLTSVLNLKHSFELIFSELKSVVIEHNNNYTLAILETIEYVEDTQDVITALTNYDTSVKGLSKLPKTRLVAIYLHLENLMYRIEDIMEDVQNAE